VQLQEDLLERQPAALVHQVDEPEVAGAEYDDLLAADVVLRGLFLARLGPLAGRLVERGQDLVLQNEWFEIDRTIHMNGREPPADQPYTPLGYSAGKWENGALVITTTHIDWPYFELYGLVGVPQSKAMRIVERITPRDDGATLKYDFSATDPAAFTETVTYDGYVTFRWQPALEFLPYDCVETERKARNAR